MARTLLGALLNRAAQIDTPIPYPSRGTTRALPFMRPAGMEAQMRAMGSVGTLFSIVNRTSNATAQVQWKLWRKAASGKKEDRVEVTSHAALDLWNRPNPFMPQQEFVETFQQHLDLTGEAWWVVARDPRSTIPLELWPVRPDRMTPVPSRERFLAGYIYTSPDGEQVPLGLDEVIFLRMPNPLDPYRGMGPVQSILADLDATRYSAEWNRNFFLNSAEPGGIIEIPTALSDPDFDQLRDRWNEQHRGVANAHRVAILEHGKWVDRKLSQRDMQFAELRSVSRDVIREAFGMPAFALGEVADVNRATAEASKAWFAEQLTVPRLERIKGALNHDFLPLYGPTTSGLEYDYENPVPSDPESEATQLTARSSAAATLADAGWDPDDILNAVGLPAMRHAAPVAVPVSAAKPAAAKPSARLFFGTADAPHRELEQVRQQQETALNGLLSEWAGIAEAQIHDLGVAVEAAVDAEDVTALSALTVSTDDAAATLVKALGAQAGRAAQQMADEAAAQGVTVTVPDVDKSLINAAWPLVNFGGELFDIATATAAILGADLARQAAVEALRQYTPGAVGSRVANAVKNQLRSLKGRFRRDQLGAALHRATNVGRLAVLDEAPPAVYEATETLDKNTCLAPEVLVTTRSGSVPAKDVTLDDELLTHTGRWTKPDRIVVSEVEEQLTRVVLADCRSLRLTWDHPVLVLHGGGFVWRNAGDLAVGDFVVDQSTLELGREVSPVDLSLGQAPDGVSTVGDVSGLPPVDVGAQRVPVVPVGFDDEGIPDEEIHDPGAYLSLGSVGAPEVFESLTDSAFDAGLGVAGVVAADRAVPPSAGPGRDGSELVSAVFAGNDDGRSTAGLGAVASLVDLGVPKGGTASFASGGDASGVAACPRAADVAGRVADGNAEILAALRANLGDLVLTRSDLGAYLGVGELALHRAVDAPVPGPRWDQGGADLASRRHVVRVLSAPRGAEGAALAERTDFDRNPARRTRPIHDLSVQVATVQVAALEQELHVGEVFDFTVPGDETFWAEGALVHNCRPCEDIDGVQFPTVAAARAVYGAGGYHECKGGERCRGTVVATWESEQ